MDVCNKYDAWLHEKLAGLPGASDARPIDQSLDGLHMVFRFLAHHSAILALKIKKSLCCSPPNRRWANNPRR
jgi:hypothetical protein